MEIWYEGTFGNNHKFELFKTETRVEGYSLFIDKNPCPILSCFERRSQGYECFDTIRGVLAFPWNWGRGIETWPRFEEKGEPYKLIRLITERGHTVDFTLEKTKWMEQLFQREKGKLPVTRLFPRA